MRQEFQMSTSGSNSANESIEKRLFEVGTVCESNHSLLKELERCMEQEFFSASPQPAKYEPKQHFTYRALETEEHIRLFHVEPGLRTDSIKGYLQHTSLASRPEYEALSYSWGSPNKEHQLRTDEGSIMITDSVRSALIRLRHHDRPRVLWIDALCINQDNSTEKAQQVLLMAKIYASASKVMVHLGDEADGSDEAIELIHKIAKTNFSTLSSKFKAKAGLTSFGLQPESHVVWRSFRLFWRRPWFRRVWIIQEFLFARDIAVICGEWEGSWQIFPEAATKINDFGLTLNLAKDEFVPDSDNIFSANAGMVAMSRLCELKSSADYGLFLQYRFKDLVQLDRSILKEAKSLDIPGLESLASMVRQNPTMTAVWSQIWDRDTLHAHCDFFHIPRPKPRPTEFQGMPLERVLYFTKHSEATDSRDRLFALLSLANDLSDEERNFLRPNYDEPVKHVACRYASVFVQKGQCMNMLYDIVLQSSPSMPSWMPNWFSKFQPVQSPCPLGIYGRDIYRAAGESTPKARIGEKDDVVVLTGGFVDAIVGIGLGPVLNWTAGLAIGPVADLTLLQVDCVFGGMSSYPTGESLFEVKWRTLVANKAGNYNTQAPNEYARQYEALRKHLKKAVVSSGPIELFTLYPPSAEPYFLAIGAVSGYKLCRTRGGYVGMVPLHAKRGDQIVVFLGGIVPFVIRRSKERRDMFRLVGGCYIHGFMGGEALKLPQWREREIALH